jgi:hypothetical protein
MSVVGEEQPQRGGYNASTVANTTSNRGDWQHRPRQHVHHGHSSSGSNPNDEDSAPLVLIQGTSSAFFFSTCDSALKKIRAAGFEDIGKFCMTPTPTKMVMALLTT